jgi:N-acetylmuramoyl-L-alanine amidase
MAGAVLLLGFGLTESTRGALETEEEAPTATAPAATPSAVISAAEAKKVVSQYYDGFSNNDLFVMMEPLAAAVDYKDAGIKEPPYIRDDLRAYMKKWPIRNFKPDHVQVAPQPDGTTRLTFDVAYTIANEKLQETGRIVGNWQLRKVDGEIQITALKEKIVKASSEAAADIDSQTGAGKTEEELGPHEVEQLEKKHQTGWAANATRSGQPSIEIVSPAPAKKAPGASPPSHAIAAATATASPTAKLAAAEAKQPKKNATDFTLALDIGHSPLKGGAMSARGKWEYEFNKRMVNELFKQAKTSGLSHSFIINPEHEEISLFKRSAVASAGGADLFLSIHHDSVKDRFLKDWQYEGKAQKYCDDFHGYSVFFSRKNADPEQSQAFAMMLGRSLLTAGFTPTLHHVAQENRPIVDKETGVYQFDDLIVLRSAKMPAVLLECGVIVNRDEEKNLNDAAYRKRLVDAVSSAIQDYAKKSESVLKKN